MFRLRRQVDQQAIDVVVQVLQSYLAARAGRAMAPADIFSLYNVPEVVRVSRSWKLRVTSKV